MGSTESTKELTEKVWEMSYSASYSNFVFDETSVKKQYDLLKKESWRLTQDGGKWQ